MHILIETTLNMIRNLSIRQAKSYMYVDDLVADYNNSSQMMRVKRTPDQISLHPQGHFATYFEAK